MRTVLERTILEYVQRVPDDIQWTLFKDKFDVMLATKKGVRSRPRRLTMQRLSVCR